MIDALMNEPPIETCPNNVHDFKGEYYGWRCRKCGVFYPNTAPLGAWLNGDKFNPIETESIENDNSD